MNLYVDNIDAYKAELAALGADKGTIKRIMERCRYKAGGVDTPEEEIAAQKRIDDEQAEERRRSTRTRLLKAGFPEMQLRDVFDHEPEEDDAVMLAREFISNSATFLVLLGGVGCRKTGAATWAASQFLSRDTSVFGRVHAVFADVHGLTDAFGFDKENKTRRDAIEKADLLVLDDVGAEFQDKSGYFLNQFSALIDQRYRDCKKTILTGNLTVEQLKTMYGERTIDRLRETGEVLVVGGKSRRKKRDFSVTHPAPQAERGKQPEFFTGHNFKNFDGPRPPITDDDPPDEF